VRWRVDIGLAVGFAVLTATLAAGGLLGIDLAVRDWVDAHRPYPAYLAARVLVLSGQGWLLELAVVLAAGWLGWRQRSVRPLVPVVVAYVGLNLVVGCVKVLTDRAAPHLPADVSHRERFLSGGLEYPSGHVVNAIIWYGLLVLLCGSWLPSAVGRAAKVVLPLVVAATTTYLGWHWFTDAVAGMILGVLLDRALRRVDWNTVPLGSWLAGRGWAGPVRELG
jgi:membrane-associated phospholipid phosphatase